MVTARWTPFGGEQWNQLHDEMNRAFQRLTWPALARAYPPVNVWEDADSVHVEAELPGLDIKDLEIYVTAGNQLTIKGERKPPTPEQSVWHRQERGFGTFVRVLTLPFEVDRDKVEARLENGVLLVKLAKHAAAKPRKITVKGE